MRRRQEAEHPLARFREASRSSGSTWTAGAFVEGGGAATRRSSSTSRPGSGGDAASVALDCLSADCGAGAPAISIVCVEIGWTGSRPNHIPAATIRLPAVTASPAYSGRTHGRECSGARNSSRTRRRIDACGSRAVNDRATSAIILSRSVPSSFIDISQRDELHLEPTPRFSDAPLQRSRRDSQHRRNLPVVVLARLHQEQGIAKLRRQRVNPFRNLSTQLSVSYVFVGCGCGLYRERILYAGPALPPGDDTPPSRDGPSPRNREHPRSE